MHRRFHWRWQLCFLALLSSAVGNLNAQKPGSPNPLQHLQRITLEAKPGAVV